MIQTVYPTIYIALSPTSNISMPHVHFQAQSQGLQGFAGQWGLYTLLAARSPPLVPLDEQFAMLRGGLRRWRLTPNGTGADPPAFLPSTAVTASPVSRQQRAEAHSTQGCTASF